MVKRVVLNTVVKLNSIQNSEIQNRGEIFIGIPSGKLFSEAGVFQNILLEVKTLSTVSLSLKTVSLPNCSGCKIHSGLRMAPQY